MLTFLELMIANYKSTTDMTRQSGLKLKEGRFRLGIRKKFFNLRVVRHWNRFAREAVCVPSLEVLKESLNGALTNLGGYLCHGVGIRWSSMSLPTQTILGGSYDSIITLFLSYMK